MISKDDIAIKALEIGFLDAGFTTAEPFTEHLEMLESRKEEYGWAETTGLALMKGTDPGEILPGAKSVIVVLEGYFMKSFPKSMENHFGRCYLDDDRITRDGLALKIKALRNILRAEGIDSKVPFNLPHRAAAARAGLGTLGKNCLFYAGKSVCRSSWVIPVTIVTDREFEPDRPSLGMGCPQWCRNVCVSACPTRALKGNGTIDPKKCISYLTYYGEGLTPVELREPMGLYVYGCDRCQNVCPRNSAWLSRELPANEKVAVKADQFALVKLLHMDKDYFVKYIWPHMFYVSPDDLWKWKMNVARVMGNTLDDRYVPELSRAFSENSDFRIRAMAAWALGRIGGAHAVSALKEFFKSADDTVRAEIESALENAV